MRVAMRAPGVSAVPRHRLPPQEQGVRAALARRVARAAMAGRERSCWPAPTSSTAPRWRREREGSWTRIRQLRQAVIELGPVTEAGEGVVDATRSRGRVPVGIRGVRARPVREARCAGSRACSRRSPRWQRGGGGTGRDDRPLGSRFKARRRRTPLLADQATRASHVQNTGRLPHVS